MLFLRFAAFTLYGMLSYLPHILTMGRGEILQQTRFKALKCKPPLKNASLALK
ncbi:hypothetical protein [Helicobacter pylori]|uniref:hypothetical protein n=1 Tax=Helicobacter pylori TaxID=210 RepID=UPI0018E36AFD|nr:hypothetical protein [Helicobacter pylori]